MTRYLSFFKTPLFPLGVLSILSLSANAYWIDTTDPEATCNDQNKATVMKTSIDSAVVMIQQAQGILENLGQQDSKLQTLAQLVFGDNNGINGATQFFSRVGNALNQNGAKTQSNTPDKIRFFCDTSYLDIDTTSVPGKVMTFDNRFGEWINGDISLGGNHDHGVTYSDSQGNNVQYSCTVLQPNDIAQWQGRPDMSIPALINQIKNHQQLSNGEDHADNICSTPDVTIAHEMFHTNLAMANSAWSTRAIDVNGCEVSTSDWTNIRTCATNGNGFANADSLAYFACLSMLVKELNWRVFDSGRIRGFGN